MVYVILKTNTTNLLLGHVTVGGFLYKDIIVVIDLTLSFYECS